MPESGEQTTQKRARESLSAEHLQKKRVGENGEFQPWPCIFNREDVGMQYVWKRPRNNAVVDELVRPFEFTSRQEMPLNLHTRVRLFQTGEVSCADFARALPGWFAEFEARINALWNYSMTVDASKLQPPVSPEAKVQECVEFVVLLGEWVTHVGAKLAPNNFDTAVSVLFEKALSCSTMLHYLRPEPSEVDIEASKSSIFVVFLFRSCIMHIHSTLSQRGKTPTSFDNNAREVFATESLLNALQLAAATRRWFLSPVLWPEGNGAEAPIQPALAWLQALLTWKQRSSSSLWPNFKDALQNFSDRSNWLTKAERMEVGWELLTLVLAPLHMRVMVAEFPTAKRCDFCKRVPQTTACGDWSTVKEFIEDREVEGKIHRIAAMLRLWCPDRHSSQMIRSLFGVGLNPDVNSGAFLADDGVFLLAPDRAVTVGAPIGKFLKVLGLLANYVQLMDEADSERWLSHFFTSVECKVKKNSSDADLKLLIQNFSILLTLGTTQGRLPRVLLALQGMSDLSEGFAECDPNTQAIVLRAFYLFGALSQDHKQDIEPVITIFRKWLKMDGLTAQVFTVIERLFGRSTSSRDYNCVFATLRDLLKDEKLLDKVGDGRRRLFEMLSRISTGLGSDDSLPLSEMANDFKTMFQSSLSVRGPLSETVLLGQLTARFILLCQAKTGLDLKEFELRPASAIRPDTQKKALYSYWGNVLSTDQTEGSEGFSRLLQLAPSSPFSSSFDLPRLLLDLFKADASQLHLLPSFFTSLSLLFNSVSPSSLKPGGKGAPSLAEAKYGLVSELFQYLCGWFAKGKPEAWEERVAVALSGSGESMVRLRELVLPRVVYPLLLQCQCYKHLISTLLQVVARIYAQGGSSQELNPLPGVLAHLLTLSQNPTKPWERWGLVYLRYRVYDLLRSVKYKWPESFCTLLQQSVLRELDAARNGGRGAIKLSHSVHINRTGSEEWKQFYGELKVEAPTESVTAEECLQKGIAALPYVFDVVPPPLILELDKVLGASPGLADLLRPLHGHVAES